MNISDEYIRQQFYIIGLGNWLGDLFVSRLNQSRRSSHAILLEMLPKIWSMRPLSAQRAKYLKDLAREVAESRGEQVTRFRKEFEETLKILTQRIFAKSNELYTKIPLDGEPDENPVAVIPILLGSFLYQGATIDDWFINFKHTDEERIRRGIQAGVVNNRSSKQIMQDLFGSREQQWRDGELNASNNFARSMIRTLVTGLSTAALGMWTTNYSKRFPMREVYTAILDSRTTFRCASLHGGIYEVGVGPYPPQHMNCRSHRYPIPDVLAFPSRLKADMSANLAGKDFVTDARRRVGGAQWDKLTFAGKTQAITDEKSRWLLRNVGDTTTELGFGQWFGRQPEAFKKDYLGPTRYAAWKKNDLTIDALVSPQGHRYTIAELEQRGVL